ncbi:hypothetical protein AB0D12_34300 [Streptomyces sp. NPDC048479]|uniref:hypothetical protein n=1 Tax=Streptomyces sp. NPDC048479 TaxID=3154725 RepID=UPI003414D970
MAGKLKTNPAGSTNSFRGDVLRVLGALKVATADQIQRIGAPHLSFRHTDKETPSEQKTARTASHTGALSGMRKHGLTENGGSTTTGERLRNLTLKRLEAASCELRRPVTEMGSTARGAGSSGASHPVAVNETVIAMLRPKPNLAKLTEDPPEVRSARADARYWGEEARQNGGLRVANQSTAFPEPYHEASPVQLAHDMGYLPLEAYRGPSRPWSVRCTACGEIRRIRLGVEITSQGRQGCRRCVTRANCSAC